MTIRFLLMLTSIAAAADVDRLAQQLRRYGLSKAQIFNMIQRPSEAAQTAESSPRTINENIADEIQWLETSFPGGVEHVADSPRCPADGSECYEVIIAAAGSYLDPGATKKTALNRLRTRLDPDYRRKAKHEVSIFVRIPKQYPDREIHLRITDSNGFLKREVRALESVLRKIARRSRARSRPALKAICRRALRFVTNPDDALRSKPISIWLLVVPGAAFLLAFKYMQWRLQHTTTVYHR